MQYYFNKLTKYLPRIVALLLILNIFGFDLFSNQTVFLLDYAPTPIRVWEWSHYLTIPGIWMAHDGLLLVLGYIQGSKVYLLSIVVTTLLLGYRWGQYLTRDRSDSNHLPLLGMILMVFNPVFSSRMGTQPGVRLGIILLGRGLYRLIRHRDRLNIKHSIVIGLFWGVAMMSMNHASFMIFACLTGLVLVMRSWKLLRSALIIGGVVGLLNLNWILGGLLGSNTTIAQAQTFSQQNIEEFMTYEHSGLGPVVTSMFGYGFWGEKYGSAFAPTRSNPRWWVAGLIILLLAGYGRVTRYRHKPKQAQYLGGIMIVSIVLGVGIASDMLAPMIQRLYDHVPGYRGLREPHKRIGLYMIIIIPLAIVGYRETTKWIVPHLTSGGYVVMVILIAFARSPGSARQMMLRYDMTHYPSSYNQTRDLLVSQGGSGHRLQLPWHSYHRCQWNNKVIANTLNQYMYPASMITSDNIEVGQLYTNSTNPRSRSIDAFIADHDLSHLSGYNIQGIVYLSQCADFKNYEWIASHTGLSQIADYGDVQIYSIWQ